MKKILAILLAAMMIISLFAGCSEEEPEEQQGNLSENENSGEIVFESLNKTITAVVYDRGEDEAYDKTYWNEIKSDFEAANQALP